MSVQSLDFTYRYTRPSIITDSGLDLPCVRLATSSVNASPHFLDATLVDPVSFAESLLCLASIVRTHFFLPKAGLLDPVVTSGEGALRFEGFSGCVGVYVHAIFRNSAFREPIVGRGTTNIDINEQLRNGLARIRASQQVRLTVGANQVAVNVDDNLFVEKKVKLPLRWLRGFCEVQAYLSKAKPVTTMPASELLRFVRSLPRNAARSEPMWAVAAGKTLRLTSRKSDSAVRIAGTDRLRSIEPLLRHGKGEVTIWSEPESGVSVWCLGLPTSQFQIALSPELYRGFSGEGQVLSTLATETWQNAIDQEGKLDRQRLLKRSLEGMALPLSATTLGGFGKFHEMLEPTVDERELLVDDYLRLLASSNSTVVGSALSALEKLQKVKRLNADLYLDAMPNAFLVDKKSQPITAIKLAVKLMKQSPACKPKAAKAIIPAIRHTNADVQIEAISVLETCHELIDRASEDDLSTMTDSVAVAVRPKFMKLLQSCGTAEPAPASSEKSSAKVQKKTNAKPSATGEVVRELTSSKSSPIDGKLLKEAGTLPDALRHRSRLEDAIAALISDSPPIILPLAKHVAPRRDPSCTIKPVESLDELIVLVSSVIEGINDIMDLERVLDGICRFHLERPDDFDKRVGALRQRIASRAENHNQEVLYYSIDIGFPQLLMSWLNLPPMVQTRTIHWYHMRGWFLRERISSIQNTLVDSMNPHSRQSLFAMPMLALPTHKGGWLDPVVLVERLNNNYAKQRELPCLYDLAQAILRLTPDGRNEALGMLGEPDHYNGGTCLRYALGDDCEIRTYGGWGSEAVMLAAERARAIILAEKEYVPVLPIARASLDDRQLVSITGAILDDPTVPFTLAEVAFSLEPTPTDVFDPKQLNHLWIRSWEALTNPMDMK